MLIIHIVFLLIPPTLVTPIICIGKGKDFYSYISGLENLLELERHLLDNWKHYVDQEYRKNDQIKLVLDNFELENRKATINPEDYLSDPLSVFRALKRSVVDLKDLNNYILGQANENDAEDDLSGAVLGLTRLQKTYRLNASDLANGRIMGTQYSTDMSADDLFHIGRQLYEAEDYKVSYEWLSLSRDRLDSEKLESWSRFNHINFFELISSAAYRSTPFKLEQLSIEPPVYYHDVVYDSEIEKVFETAVPEISRSTVGTGTHSTIRNIEEVLEGRGDRIATALFYISDVEFGGATAFPFLKLAVKPIRHSLVFWYNLHDSNDPDYRMCHAGCPVLKGSKWIHNLWLRELGQESKRPCGLHQTAYLSAQYNN